MKLKIENADGTELTYVQAAILFGAITYLINNQSYWPNDMKIRTKLIIE